MLKTTEIEKILHDDSPEVLESLAREAETLTRRRFGRTMQLYAPLYISNECIDTCTYCGFSRPNPINRRTLTVEKVERECDYLIGEGFRHLLLVAGEHPKMVSPSFLLEVARRIRSKLAFLSMEVSTFDVDTYRELARGGIDGVVIYQETYDRGRYEEVHKGGPKRDYDARVAVPENAARGGMRRVGMGILLGLSDWRNDVIALVDHVRYLQKRYWQTEFQISLPRLRPCFGGISPSFEVTDRDLVRLYCLLRIVFPDVGLVLSTREPPALRDGLMRIGVTQMSAGSRTEPGGYLEPEASGEQFSISDDRSPAEVAAAIAKNNLEPVWKDWEQGSRYANKMD